MGVDRPDGHRNAFRQSQPRSPLAAQPSGNPLGGVRFGGHPFGETPQSGPQSVEERRRRPAAPRRMPQPFVPGGTAAAQELFGTGIARQQRAHPVAVLDPRIGGVRHRRIGFQDMQHFGPGPLRRVDAARIERIIRIGLFGRRIDLSGFGDGRVVLPQDEHRVRLPGKTRGQRQRRSLRIGQNGRGTGRIERQGANFTRHLRRNRGESLPDGLFKGLGIIQRMLAVTLAAGIAIQPLFPARIMADRRSDLTAVFAVDDQRPAGIGPVVYSDHIFPHNARSSLHTKTL